MFLSLDTSTLTVSVALVETRGSELVVVDEACEGPPQKQSEMLPGLVEGLLARQKLSLEQLEGIAVGIGPGSFTGLRIGLAMVKGFAYAKRLRVAPVSSLAAMALEGPEGVPLLVAMGARRNEVYVGTYERTGRAVTELAPEDGLTVEELAERIRTSPSVMAMGPGIAEYGERLEALGVRSERLAGQPLFPKARHLATLAVFPTAYEPNALFALEPHYVRPSEAEKNPKFPPLPGPLPTARLKDDES